jgi:hypothetical protein
MRKRCVWILISGPRINHVDVMFGFGSHEMLWSIGILWHSMCTELKGECGWGQRDGSKPRSKKKKRKKKEPPANAFQRVISVDNRVF